MVLCAECHEEEKWSSEHVSLIHLCLCVHSVRRHESGNEKEEEEEEIRRSNYTDFQVNR